ncbi:PREDICTED: synaptotagmin-8, partial [Lipotes vexillifer]|uniref:Synaptotagmin-8 n=1 Tax=Lipotes vexillifer TaxID=118797 RepID=A0A340Y3H8_LIPVE
GDESPPGPHSAQALAGSTAVPGLIPDLVARIPWLRWALIATAVVAGVLVSCLLCAICCRCRGRHRKEPRDEEAVGLGSARSTINTHLVQPDVDHVEPGPGGPQQWGCLQLSVEYNSGSQEIKVGLKQAADLRPRGPGGMMDPYSRVSLSPEVGCRHETKVHRSALCPMFEETCSFHVPPVELPRTALRGRVLDHELFPSTSRWPEQLGEVCFSLQYVPGSGRLTVDVLEARGLSLVLAEPYVKVPLVPNQRKWKKRKTSARKGMATPYFSEAFTFPVPFSQIQSVALMLAVGARGPQFRAEPVSKVLLGAWASGQPLQHWADMLAHAWRPIAQGHCLQPAREVDRAQALQAHLRLPLPGS